MATSAYMLMTTKFGKKRIVAKTLLKFEEIEFVEEVYGHYDIIIKIIVEDAETLEEFIQNNIRTIEDIDKAETLIVAKSD